MTVTKRLVLWGALAGSVLLIFLGRSIWANNDRDSTAHFDHQYYQYLVDQQFTSPVSLSASLEMGQAEYLLIAPPDPGFTLWQDWGIHVFDPSGFPKTFVEGLIPQFENGIPFYRVWIYEDRITRYRIFENNKGTIIGSLPPSAGYSPDWFALWLYPDLYAERRSADEVYSILAMYDPARVGISFRLLAKQDALKYVLSLSPEKPDPVSHKPADSPIIIMKAYTGPAVTNIQFTCAQVVSNQMVLTVAYPAGFSNDLEFFTCTNIVGTWWNAYSVTNIQTGTNWVEWTDYSWTNHTVRFYAVGDADTDTDGDTLTDAREYYVYHTSSTTNDTDGDALSDYTECLVLNTDPNNSDTNKPIALIEYPTNGFHWVWLP